MSSGRPHIAEIAAVRQALAELGHPWQATETRMSRLPAEWRAARLGVPTPTEEEIAAREGQADGMAAAALSALGQPVTSMGSRRTPGAPAGGESGFFRIAYGDSFIEDYPGSRPTAFGCTSVSLRAWLPARRTTGLFATANDANGWAYLENFGWAHLSGGPHTTANKLIEVTHARGTGRQVSPFIDGTELDSMLVYD